MFTGIIEEIGIIKNISRGENASIIVNCTKAVEDVKIGDSIAIDGICQTITAFDEKGFTVQISQETLNVTTFSKIKAGAHVNLERALTLNSRLGGHIVTGHIDGLAKLKSIQPKGGFYDIGFEVEKDLAKYIAKKGSVALNGISLTVADINANEFSTALIPQTFKNTNLSQLQTGDFVNIEVDILAKYIEKILSRGNNGTIDENFLKENGFF